LAPDAEVFAPALLVLLLAADDDASAAPSL